MKRKFIAALLLALLTLTPVQVLAQDGDPEPTEETITAPVTTDAETQTSIIDDVGNQAENEPIAMLIVLMIGLAIGAIGSQIRNLYRLVNEALSRAQETLDESPLGFVDIRALAADFIRAALTHNQLEGEQQQIDWAVKQIETAIATVSAKTKVDLAFLMPYVRPAVNAAYHRVLEELARLENGDGAPEPASMAALRGEKPIGDTRASKEFGRVRFDAAHG